MRAQSKEAVLRRQEKRNAWNVFLLCREDRKKPAAEVWTPRRYRPSIPIPAFEEVVDWELEAGQEMFAI